jgi:hypothetical protein
LNVYAAQTGLLQVYRTYLDLLNELAQAASDVTLTTGLPPARLVRAGQPLKAVEPPPPTP